MNATVSLETKVTDPLIDDVPFSQVYQKMFDQIRRYVLRKVGDEHKAQDITQDVFTKVLLKHHQYQQGTNFNAWVYRIASNTTFNYFNKHKREQVTDPQFFIREADPRRDTLIETHLLHHKLSNVLDCLHHPFKETAQHFYLNASTYDDIAQELQIPVGTVMSRLYRARTILKQAYPQYEWLRCPKKS